MEKLSNSESKSTVFDKVEAFLTSKKLNIKSRDESRPWGGFFVIHEEEIENFIALFFPQLEFLHNQTGTGFAKLSPKVLIVAPGKRLSWQYHHRRAELWRVVNGRVGVVVSDTNQQTPIRTLSQGEEIRLMKGERHRLVGLDTWGIVAEIWHHTDPAHPSDEQDIVRLEDDFNRN